MSRASRITLQLLTEACAQRISRCSTFRCALSFVRMVCEVIPDGPRLIEKHGGLQAIDDVHYSGQAR